MGDPHAQLDPDDVTVVAAMANEARPLRRLVPQLRLLRAGIGLADMAEPPSTPVAFSVGLAGGFDPRLAPGTVVIPREVAREDGVMLACDVAWSAALERASIQLGFPTVTLPMLSAAALVTHAGRAAWFERGFAAVDMETALLAGMVARVAAVRVILDTPLHEISPAWVNPRRAAADPRNWREAAWLARWVPRYTRRAAQVIARALEDVRTS
jgi:adenosylhomocysteine nucleosidase